MTYRAEKKLAFELLLVAAIIVLPFSVHAGVFSSLFKVKEEARAEEMHIPDTNAQTVPLLKASLSIDPSASRGGGDILVSENALVPDRDINTEDRPVVTSNGEVSVYVVREGDTLSQIAEMFEVSAKTILWANDIAKASHIKPGDALVILPISGVRHVVKSGDTIAGIAKKYQGDTDEIITYNQLASASDISIGDTIVVPGGVVMTTTAVSSGSAKSSGKTATVASGGSTSGFTHPVPGAVRTQGIHGYNGVDLAAPIGTAVRAAGSGTVVVARASGYNGGYGSYVVIKHANGVQTLYAHLSRVYVGVGATVTAGETIGAVGNTGRSTGAHLHFEVRGDRNPF